MDFFPHWSGPLLSSRKTRTPCETATTPRLTERQWFYQPKVSSRTTSPTYSRRTDACDNGRMFVLSTLQSYRGDRMVEGCLCRFAPDGAPPRKDNSRCLALLYAVVSANLECFSILSEGQWSGFCFCSAGFLVGRENVYKHFAFSGGFNVIYFGF